MFRLTLCTVVALLTGCGSNGSPGDVSGRWLTHTGNLEVEIAPCDQALCGTVVRVISSSAMAPGDHPQTDSAEAGLLGLKILDSFTSDGEGKWKGHIYNRDNGKTYDCIMTLAGPNEIELRPYVFIPLFGRTQSWRRIVAGKT